MPKRVFAFKSAVPSSWLNLIENHTHSDPTAEGAGGQLSIKTEDIQTAAITPAKLSMGAPSWTSDGTVSASSFSGAFAGTLTGSVSGNVTGDLTGNVTGNASTATALTTASGSAPSYAARAWVNFNGTGTVAIRASGNVSSITDNGTGDYTMNFTTAMPDANYAILASLSFTSGSSASRIVYVNSVNTGGISAPTTGYCRIASVQPGAGGADVEYIQVGILR